MPEREDTSKQSGGNDVERLARQVAYLRKAVASLMILCLATSIGLNVYLGSAYSAARREAQVYRKQAEDEGDLRRLYTWLITDLRSLSRTDPTARGLLRKYQIPESPPSNATHAPPG